MSGFESSSQAFDSFPEADIAAFAGLARKSNSNPPTAASSRHRNAAQQKFCTTKVLCVAVRVPQPQEKARCVEFSLPGAQ